MAQEPRLLPLFPLHTVLFPGMELPIRVFEPRYRRMLDECMRADRKFGVVLIQEGREVGGSAEPHRVGTAAYIEDVRPTADGTLAVSTEGRERFRVLDLIRERQYLSAMVETLDEPLGEGDVTAAADEVRATAQVTLNRLLALNTEWVRRVPLPRDPLRLSYSVAERLPLDLPVRQELLEAETTLRRLQLELPILEAEGRRVEQLLQQRHWLGGLPLN